MIKNLSLKLLALAIRLYRHALANEVRAALNKCAAVDVRLERHYDALDLLNARFGDIKRAQRQAADGLNEATEAAEAAEKKLEGLL